MSGARTLIAFECEGETLIGTLDQPEAPVEVEERNSPTIARGSDPARTGLLIVSGGNEIRIGAHRGMARLAQMLAREGVPVFRYDRRGIGDSSGENLGFEESAADIAAAAEAFRGATEVERIVAFGNCDGASALALFHADAGIDTLLLSNPWTGAEEDDLPAAAAIKARYAERLRDPRQWLRLAKGEINLSKLKSGLSKLAQKKSKETPLLDRMAAALNASGVTTVIALAERDNTAIGFRAGWDTNPACRDVETMLVTLDSASHSYAGPDDLIWLKDTMLGIVRTGG